MGALLRINMGNNNYCTYKICARIVTPSLLCQGKVGPCKKNISDLLVCDQEFILFFKEKSACRHFSFDRRHLAFFGVYRIILALLYEQYEKNLSYHMDQISSVIDFNIDKTV